MHGEIFGEEQLVFGSSICHIKCGEKNSMRNGEKIQEKMGKNLGKNGEKSRKKWGKKSRKNQEKNVEKNGEKIQEKLGKNVEKNLQDGPISKYRKNFENETQKKFWG